MSEKTEKSTCQYCGLTAGPIKDALSVAAFFGRAAGPEPTCDPCYRARQDTPDQAAAAYELTIAALGGDVQAEALLFEGGYLIWGTLPALLRLAVSLARWAPELAADAPEREGVIPAPEIEEIDLLRLVAENEDIDFRLSH